MVSGHLRPQLVDEPLVFVKKPTLTQLLVLHSVKKDPLNTSRRISQILDGEKCAERVAHQNIFHIHEFPRCPNRRMRQCRECRITSPVSAGQWTLAHVMQLDVVVVRSKHLLEIGCEPGLGIRPKYPLDFFFRSYGSRVVQFHPTVLALQVGHHTRAGLHQLVRLDTEDVVLFASRCPHFVILQQIRIDEDAQLLVKPKRRHAKFVFGNPLNASQAFDKDQT